MNRSQLLQRLDAAWRDFQSSYEGATDAELVAPRFDGGWSIRHLIAHIAIWEEEALKHLPTIIEGGRPPRYSVIYGGIDAFNAQAMARWEQVSPAEVLVRARETHERLVAFVETSVPELQLARESPTRRRLRLDTYAHYALHARSIRQSREAEGSQSSLFPGGITQ